MRFRFRGSYSCGEQFECKDSVTESQGCGLQHVAPPLEFKIRGTHDDTMPREEVVSRLRAKFHRRAHPRAGAVCAVPVSRTPCRSCGRELLSGRAKFSHM